MKTGTENRPKFKKIYLKSDIALTVIFKNVRYMSKIV